MVFGAGLSYTNPAARFTKGYLAVISREPFPDSILYDRHEMVVLKSKMDSTQVVFLEHVYANASTKVTGTNTDGDSFNLDLAQGWNQMVVRFKPVTSNFEYLSTTPPADLAWTAYLQSGQVLVAGNPTKTTDDRKFTFIDSDRIVLEYGRESQTTRLYTPGGQGNFTYVTPLEVSGEELSRAEDLFGNQVTVTGPPDAQFARLRLRVYTDTGGGPGYPIRAELYKGKLNEQQNFVFLDYFYSSTEGVTLNGGTEGSDSYNNLSLSKGWNIVKGIKDFEYQTVTYSNPDPSTYEGME